MVVDLVVGGLAGAGLSKFAVFGWLVSPLNVHWLLCCFSVVYVLFVFPPCGVVCGLVKLCLWVWWLVVVLVVVGQRLHVEFGWWVSPLGVSSIAVVCVARLRVCVFVCVCERARACVCVCVRVRACACADACAR